MALVTDLSQPDANAYVSVAALQAYCQDFGLSLEGSPEGMEAAIRRASQYLDRVYRWKGQKANAAQAMAWPRVGGEADLWSWEGAAGRAIRSACCELAARALREPIVQDVEAQSTISITVGPISKTRTASSNGGQKRYVVVDALVSDYVLSSDIRVGRA